MTATARITPEQLAEIHNAQPGSVAKVVAHLPHVEFRPFTKTDWYGFAGCESAEPMIGERVDLVWVLDGSELGVYDADGNYLFGATLRAAHAEVPAPNEDIPAFDRDPRVPADVCEYCGEPGSEADPLELRDAAPPESGRARAFARSHRRCSAAIARSLTI